VSALRTLLPVPATSLVFLTLLALGTFLAGGRRLGPRCARYRVVQAVRTFFGADSRLADRACYNFLAAPPDYKTWVKSPVKQVKIPPSRYWLALPLTLAGWLRRQLSVGLLRVLSYLALFAAMVIVVGRLSRGHWRHRSRWLHHLCTWPLGSDAV